MLWFFTWLVECYGFGCCCCLFDYSTTRVVDHFAANQTLPVRHMAFLFSAYEAKRRDESLRK